jgi:hypothetical protein
MQGEMQQIRDVSRPTCDVNPRASIRPMRDVSRPMRALQQSIYIYATNVRR